MNKEEFANEIGKLRPGSTFLVLHKYRSKGSGEVADFNIIFNMSYENALKRSIEIVEKFEPSGSAEEKDLQRRAQIDVLSSFTNSLHHIKASPLEFRDDGYGRFYNDEDQMIDGIKLHLASNELHLFGLINQKRVITPGSYKTVKSADLTIAKNKIRNACPVSKFRQFIINKDCLEKVSVQKLSLLPPEPNLGTLVEALMRAFTIDQGRGMEGY